MEDDDGLAALHSTEHGKEPTEPENESDEYGDGVDYSEHFQTELVFSTYEEALQWARNVSRPLGFLLVSSLYKTHDDGRPYRDVACDRGKKNKVRNVKNAIRKDTRSKANNCPFKIKVEFERSVNGWQIVVNKGITGTHNHRMVVYPEGHWQMTDPSARAKKVVKYMTEARVAPRNIMQTFMRRYPDDHPNSRHIYNCRSDLRRGRSDGREIVQQVLHLARRSKYITWILADTNNVLQHAFIAHPEMTNLLRTFPYVTSWNSTYKSNQYGMPFFEIAGVTSTNRNFLVAYGFMRSETEDSYRWVLEKLRILVGYEREPSVFISDTELGLCAALRIVFPNTSHLLCRWHINKEVAAKVTVLVENRKELSEMFINESWNYIINATSEEEYEAARQKLITRWSRWPDIFTYVQGTWLNSKEKFVKYWTNKVMHFGNVVNCKVESQHSALKCWIERSTEPLGTVWAEVHCSMKDQIIAIKNALEPSRSITCKRYKILALSRLNTKVSHYCLSILLAEIHRIQGLSVDVHETCGCTLQSTHGLPCACQIYDLAIVEKWISTEMVHPYWKTLVIGAGVDIPKFFDENDEDRKHFRNLCDEVVSSDPVILRRVSRMIQEELNSNYYDLREPEVITRTRGRPTDNWSMRREPSFFEQVVARTRTRPPPMESDGYDMNQCRWRQFIPDFLWPYILEIKDVLDDGNCGFRCVADYVDGDQHNWRQTRHTMANEIAAFPQLYSRIYYDTWGMVRGSGLESELTRIRWFGDSAREQYWMVANQDLYVIASIWNVVVVNFGVGTNRNNFYPCTTILPLYARGSATGPNSELLLAHVGGSHFVQMRLRDNHPIPPINTTWFTARDPSVVGWETRYQTRINMWRIMTNSL